MGEAALHGPVSRQHHEAGGVVAVFDDGQGEGQDGGGEGDQPAGVAAVGPDQGDAVVLGAQLFKEVAAGVVVPDGGGGDGHHEQ